MLFLATTHLAEPSAARPFLVQEMDHVRTWRDIGALHAFVVRADGAGAYLLLDADGVSAAHTLMAGLPLVLAGVMTYELVAVTDPFSS